MRLYYHNCYKHSRIPLHLYGILSEMAFYEKVIKVKADVAAYLN
jgi:hypothetical protein